MNKLTVGELARLIAYYGVRNSELENLHVDHITDKEMRVLMLDIEARIEAYLSKLISCGMLQIRNRSIATEMLRDGEFGDSVPTEAQLRAIDTGDWHSILELGPSYDRKNWPEAWAINPNATGRDTPNGGNGGT